METVVYADRNIPVIFSEFDCCVVGGGTAGAAAAISACLNTVSVLVIEKALSLGGTQISSLVTPMMSTNVEGSDQKINDLIKSKLKEYGDCIEDAKGGTGWFNGEILAQVLENLITSKNGKILYGADLVDAVIENDCIKYLIINTVQGLCAVSGKTYIDSTGDALLSRLSGIKVFSGDKNGENQSPSFRFEMGGIDLRLLYEYMQSIGDTFCPFKPPFYEIAMVPDKGFVLEKNFRDGVNRGELKESDIKYFQAFSIPSKRGVMSFNCPEISDIKKCITAEAYSNAVIYGRGMIRRLTDFLIKNIPGFKDAYLLKEAASLGIRESYRINGKYKLSEKDYISRKKFEDAVAKTAYYIDIHGDELVNEFHLNKGEYYEIPYRSMITDDIGNLVVAGRCISATFRLQSSLRIQPTCRDMGEAAGKACAYSVHSNVLLNKIEWSKIRDDN
ncbi:MAG: FAD-dependent oxidoreductase [bacterium]|nr:FAD-dependent oxidoreductase [bacterium]